MKDCYYKLTDIDVKFEPEMYVVPYVANREELLHTAIRSRIADHVFMSFEYEPIAKPIEPINYEYQPYELALSDAFNPLIGKEFVKVNVTIEYPTDYIVRIEMPESYNPFKHDDSDFTDADMRTYIQQELDQYFPIQIKTTMEEN